MGLIGWLRKRRAAQAARAAADWERFRQRAAALEQHRRARDEGTIRLAAAAAAREAWRASCPNCGGSHP